MVKSLKHFFYKHIDKNNFDKTEAGDRWLYYGKHLMFPYNLLYKLQSA